MIFYENVQGVRDIKHLFLSYSSENVDNAETLRKLFEENGIKVWMANHDIEAGDDFASSIQEAIDNCSCFTMLLTEEAQKSPWVPKELDAAISSGKPIVPVQLKPVVLSPGFKFNLINTQIFTLPNLNEGTKETQSLINAVKNHMNGKPHSKLYNYSNFHFDKKKIIIPVAIFIAVVLIVISIPLSKVFSNLSDKDNGNDPLSLEAITNSKGLPTPSSSDKNQIPDFFEDEVLALVHAESLTKANRTKTVKVGEYVSLSTVWNDATIYSQNTDIASGEGMLVKGISPGTTYVVLAASKEVCQTYCIIVEQ